MTDLISREALTKELSKMPTIAQHMDCMDVYKAIMNTPTVDAEPVRHGRWIAKEDEVSYWWECSECNSDETQKSPYCPNCGARMDLEDE